MSQIMMGALLLISVAGLEALLANALVRFNVDL
jgi:hypothetical protein